METNQQQINLRYVSPTVTSDGNVVMISDQDVPTLHFFQAREQHEGHLHGDVVASVRLNKIEDLESLAKSINDTLKQHKAREH